MWSEFEKVLRELHRQGKKRFGDDWIARLQQRRARLEGSYATLYEQNRDPIAYASLSAQTAYVFAYAPTRAEYTRQYLLRHRMAVNAPIFTRDRVEVVSFGGGPASELVGLVRYLEDEAAGEPVTAIEYIVYDKDGDWDEVATKIAAAIDTEIEITIGMRRLTQGAGPKWGRSTFQILIWWYAVILCLNLRDWKLRTE